MPTFVALTALTEVVCPDELAAVAAALQVQVMRDFLPEWGTSAIVSAAPFDAIPAGAIPVIVHDSLADPAANGFHRTRHDEAPYIMVPYGPTWSLAASHELLRMLANPSGSARTPGPSPMQAQGIVEFLVDICAPCQDFAASYTINGVVLSDFCTRGFFEATGSASSFTGQVRHALEPAANGVVTWLADDGLLYQARADASERIRIHGGFSPANRERMLLRELVDTLTPDRLTRLSNAPQTIRQLEAAQNARRAHFANQTRFREDINWRFGEQLAEADIADRHQTARRPKPYASTPLALKASRASDSIERIRTTS